jgi:hypothetical protein
MAISTELAEALARCAAPATCYGTRPLSGHFNGSCKVDNSTRASGFK